MNLDGVSPQGEHHSRRRPVTQESAPLFHPRHGVGTIAVHPLCCFGMLVEDSADLLELAGMRVVVERWDEHELVRQDATHRSR
jgi:hypothetical protein